MFAAIHIPDFPVEAMVRAEPELREHAIAVLEGTPPLAHVIAANERAAHLGIEPGMTKLQAEERLCSGGIHSAGVPDRQPPPTQGTLRQRSAQRESAAHAALLDCACAFSPRVEDTALDTVVLDVAGLERIFGPPAKMARDLARRCSEMGLEANVAVASNPDAAVLAARGFAGVTLIAEGKEAERLGELSAELLVATGWGNRIANSELPVAGKNKNQDEPEIANRQSEILDTLQRWGVRTLRALAALPPVAVAERLGQEGLRLQALARGEAQRPLMLAEPPIVFEEAMELEYPVDLLEPLAFLLNHMLEQLCARLSARALAASELKLCFELGANADDVVIEPSGDRAIETPAHITGSPDHPITRCLRLPVPMLDARIFLKLLQLDLQAHPPHAPVTRIWLRAEPAQPRRAQNGLFVPQAPEAEKLSVTLARIARVVGSSAAGGRQSAAIPGDRARVGSPEVLDTHRPGAFRMNSFSVPSAIDPGPSTAIVPDSASHATAALRLFRPALPAAVTLREGRPAHLASPERPALRGEVVWCAGPWRSSGEWWTELPWSRQEWDVAVRNEQGTTLYRIFRDEIQGKWFVEGTYD